MSDDSPTTRFAALCSADGDLQTVLVDDQGLAHGRTTLHETLDGGSKAKARRFLAAVVHDGAAYDWELVACLGSDLQVLHFVGVLLGTDQVAIIAAATAAQVHDVSVLMRVSNDQANLLRATLKRLSRRRAADEDRHNEIYESLTRLNNELAQSKREMAKANARLAELNRSKNELVGMVAHDLRNPLGAISGYAKLLSAGLVGPLSDEQVEFVERIQNTADFMSAMVEDLLDLAAIESGQIELRLSRFDLATLAGEVVGLHNRLAWSKDMTVSVHLADGLDVSADRGKIHQVMANLISNAIKYSAPGTPIVVSVTQRGDDAEFSVDDRGPGIPESEVPNVFCAFGRTSVQATGGEKSTGLGLAIAYKIIDAHGGHIHVATEVGIGSRFWFTLPTKQH